MRFIHYGLHYFLGNPIMIATFKTTFDDLFDYSFNRWNPPEDGIVKTEVCISSLVGNALSRFLNYCTQHGYNLSVEYVKNNLILLTVYLKWLDWNRNPLQKCWGVFLFYMVVTMDVIEARRNLKRYQTNVSALQQVHPQDLSVDELNTITVIIKKQNRLINNIEESLQECKRR